MTSYAYRAYMLRLWQVKNGHRSDWRVSIENPHTGERHNFTSLEALLDFLKQKASKQPGGSRQDEELAN